MNFFHRVTSHWVLGHPCVAHSDYKKSCNHSFYCFILEKRDGQSTSVKSKNDAMGSFSSCLSPFLVSTGSTGLDPQYRVKKNWSVPKIICSRWICCNVCFPVSIVLSTVMRLFHSKHSPSSCTLEHRAKNPISRDYESKWQFEPHHFAGGVCGLCGSLCFVAVLYVLETEGRHRYGQIDWQTRWWNDILTDKLHIQGEQLSSSRDYC